MIFDFPVLSVVNRVRNFHNSAQFPTTRANEKATRQLGGLFFKGE
ncbi:MAG: hypothetical protein WCC25_14295 [Candidatus Korobacteraceae bacterium]